MPSLFLVADRIAAVFAVYSADRQSDRNGFQRMGVDATERPIDRARHVATATPVARCEPQGLRGCAMTCTWFMKLDLT
jgi:hypothetical protein